ncbi:MAG: hypothetical protein K0R61_747 [Microvirga sp.]|jgi:hypothetical protein|nr:hypothetical protein [Microvirga sp.]
MSPYHCMALWLVWAEAWARTARVLLMPSLRDAAAHNRELASERAKARGWRVHG